MHKRPLVPEPTKVKRERLASHHQALRALIRKPIEHRLHARAKDAVVDAARRLMQHAEHRQPGLACDQPWPNEGRRDAIEHEHFCPARLRSPHCALASRDRSHEPSVLYGYERETGIMCGRQLGEAAMKQVPAGQASGVAECYQGG
jgi:hypothetical protein